MNLYGYVGNNSINLIDPLGLAWYHDAIIGGLNVVDSGLSFAAGVADTATFGLSSYAGNKLNDIIYGEGTGDAVDKQLKCSTSHTVGQFAGAAVPISSGVAGAARFAGPSSNLLGKGSNLFGRGGRFGNKGIANRGPVRMGWGWHNGDVFRASWSKAGSRSSWNHLDFDGAGLGAQAAMLGRKLFDSLTGNGNNCD